MTKRVGMIFGLVVAMAARAPAQDEAKMESRLAVTMQEKGVNDPSVPALVREISGASPFPTPPIDAVQAFWKDHRDEVSAALGSATVRVLTLHRESGKESAEKLRDDLLAGADFAEKAKENSIDSFAEDGGLRGEHDGAWLKIEELPPIDRIMPEVTDRLQGYVAEGEEFTAVQTLRLSPDGNQLTVKSSGGEPLTLYRVR